MKKKNPKMSSALKKYFQKKQEIKDNLYLASLKRKDKYLDSRKGRISQSIGKGLRFIQSPTRSLYSKGLSPAELKVLEKRTAELRKLRVLRQMQQMNQQPQVQPVNNFDWIFSNWGNNNNNIALQVDNEIINNSSGGYSNSGSVEAVRLDEEALRFGLVGGGMNDPFKQLDEEALRFSNIAG